MNDHSQPSEDFKSRIRRRVTDAFLSGDLSSLEEMLIEIYTTGYGAGYSDSEENRKTTNPLS